MKSIELAKLIPRVDDNEERRRTFGLLSLGLVDSLSSGVESPIDAIRYFFNGRNCLFVEKQFRDKTAQEIMGRGAQLQDLFDTLPKRQAQKAFKEELQAIRSLCNRLVQAAQRKRKRKAA
jgi:hypothetical protein